MLAAAAPHSGVPLLADSKPVLRMGNAFPALSCVRCSLDARAISLGKSPNSSANGAAAIERRSMSSCRSFTKNCAVWRTVTWPTNGPAILCKPPRWSTEVYLKLKDERAARWQSRTHFFAVAAQMMRFILVDYARRHARARRGGGAQKVTLEDAMLVSEDKGSELLLLDEALQKLEQFDKRKSQIAVMRFFAGLTVEETAEALAISAETVMRDWRLARAWLQNELESLVS